MGNSNEVNIIRNSEINCCATETSFVESGLEVDESIPNGQDVSEPFAEQCADCRGRVRPVSRRTVLLMLKPDRLEQATTGSYSFCSARDSPVVYSEDQGRRRFTVDDLRIRVGLKVKENPIPLCYCFGFDERHMRDEISRTGKSTVPEIISRLIRAGLCACDTRNPSGLCCLGEVNKAMKHLTASEAALGQ
jgi:CopZ-like zinc binding protein